MPYENYKTANNAATILFGDISASATSMSCHAGEGNLFPSTFPFLLTLEKYSGTSVIKREIIKVTDRTDDLFTIVRHAAACVQDDTADPKTQSSNGLTFTDGDSITLSYTSQNEQDVRDELALKANDSEVVKTTGDQAIGGELTADSFVGDGSQITGIQAQVYSTSTEYMLGASGTAGQGFSLNAYEQTGMDSTVYFGRAANPEVSQSFYGQDVDIANLSIALIKIGSPDDVVVVEIQTDNAGSPSGILVGSGNSDNISYIDVNATLSENIVLFSNPPELTPGVKYHLVIKRSGANSDINYYEVGRTFLTSDFIGSPQRSNGSWYGIGGDLFLKIPGYTIATPSNSVDNTNFIGVLQTAGSEGEILTFNKNYDANQTGLVAGEFYGLDDNGTFSIGGRFKALSTTELVYNISDPDNQSFSRKVTLGETVLANAPLRKGILYDINDAENNTGTTFSNGSTEIGYSTTIWAQGQSFTAENSGLMKKLTVILLKDRSPTFNIVAKIYSDTSGTLLATSTNTIAASSVGSSTSHEFTFDAGDIVKDTVYYIALEPDAVGGTTNHVHWIINGSSVYSGGIAYRTDDADNWTRQSSWDKRFQILLSHDENEDRYYNADAQNTQNLKVEGISKFSGVEAEIVDMVFDGIQQGITGVTKIGTTTGTEGDTSGVSTVAFNGSGPGQTFTVPVDCIVNSITLNNSGNTRTYEYRLYEAGVLIGTTGSDNTIGVVALSFPNNIILYASTTYEVRIFNIQDSVQKFVAYNTSDVYANGTRTDNGTGTTGDLYFEIDYTELTPVEHGDILYLSNITEISGIPGDNNIVLGKYIIGDNLLIGLDTPKSTSIVTSRNSLTASETITYTHGLGKIPSAIQVGAEAGSYIIQSEGSWTNEGGNKCLYTFATGSSDKTTSTVYCIYLSTSSEGQRGIISNVTDQTFDVEWELFATPTSQTYYFIFDVFA